MKKTELLYVDISLIPIFVALVYTGVVLHTGPFSSHEEWHNWAVAHVVSGVLFLLLAIIHIKHHWGWYKQLVKRVGNKSRITILLSLIFLFEVVTGILLVAVVEGGRQRDRLLAFYFRRGFLCDRLVAHCGEGEDTCKVAEIIPLS